MMGRGTRLCPNLFGPGQDKAFFRVFDYCGNLEFFGANPALKEPRAAKSLSERLFASRVDLVRALDEKRDAPGGGVSDVSQATFSGESDAESLTEAAVRDDALKQLQETVAGMNLENFIVRQKRRSVEKYLKPDAWRAIGDDARQELVDDVAPLPTAKRLGTEDAKRFDLLVFSLELALLKGSKRFDTLRKQLLEIVSALEDQTAIPGIAAQAELIEAVLTEQWWEGVTVPLLELVRVRLRDRVQHIDRESKAIVYSNFADELGEETAHELPQLGAVDFIRFKQKARTFLRAHEDHIVLHKLRQGRPLTATDLTELEGMLLAAGIGDAEVVERARETSQGFGRFIRSLVGLDRTAVMSAFGEFIADGSATADQIEFITMIIDHLTERGVMDPKLLYESPFTDVAPRGPDTLFDMKRTNRLFEVIDGFNRTAAVA